MKYNKSNIPVENFLNRVHIAAYAKYIKKQQDDIGQAKELQAFFRTLKDIASGKDPQENIFDRAIMNELVQEIDTQLKKNGLSGGAINKLFRRTGYSYQQGSYFERELESVIQAVLIKSFGDNIDLGSYEISTGQKLGTTTITHEMENKLKEGLAQGLSEEEVFKNNKTKTNDLYLKRVQIKTDIQGVEVDISAIKNAKMQRIQSLLQNVTISAKSYRTYTYNEQTGNMDKLKELYPTIHLGKAINPYRAIYGVLKDLGYSHSTAQAAFYAGRNKVNEGNQNVINHMYHLKYIYELTGAGTVVLNSPYKNVRFLVYNDPSTDNIYVQSAASILSDIFDENFNWHGDPLGGITISASRFE